MDCVAKGWTALQKDGLRCTRHSATAHTRRYGARRGHERQRARPCNGTFTLLQPNSHPSRAAAHRREMPQRAVPSATNGARKHSASGGRCPGTSTMGGRNTADVVCHCRHREGGRAGRPLSHVRCRIVAARASCRYCRYSRPAPAAAAVPSLAAATPARLACSRVPQNRVDRRTGPPHERRRTSARWLRLAQAIADSRFASALLACTMASIWTEGAKSFALFCSGRRLRRGGWKVGHRSGRCDWAVSSGSALGQTLKTDTFAKPTSANVATACRLIDESVTCEDAWARGMAHSTPATVRPGRNR